MSRISVLLLLVAVGCGYNVGGLYEVKSVSVPIFENSTLRRMYEIELTEVVTRHLQAQGIKVNMVDTEYELLGEIADYDRPSAVETKSDQVIVGTVVIKLNVKLKNKKTGAIMMEDSKTETAQVVGARGETEDVVREEVFDRLARWVATRLESKW
ncbi:MAG: hypothetical protein A2W23_02285 [Planctomycetes bacterium RBG_16_43_13]|nr:MAG: hypothetical protein A2W23_02285 [Planctomycetes bacterium RBG_16_43_13]